MSHAPLFAKDILIEVMLDCLVGRNSLCLCDFILDEVLNNIA